MKTLIFKYIKSDFEKTVSSWFEKIGCEVIGFDQITNGRTGLAKRIAYIKAAISDYDQNCEQVIVFDDYDFYIIYKIFGKKKALLWMWNKVTNSKVEQVKLKVSRFLGDVYSFDKDDCQKFGLKYNSQFYSQGYRPQIGAASTKQTLFFVGKDKGRYHTVEQIADYLDREHISYNFMIFPDNGVKYNRNDLLSTVYMNYEDVCKAVCDSSAVLDLVQDGQGGLTLRAMEALFFDKKIVTNNKSYKDYGFYSSDKIYIIQGDGLDGLSEFLNKRLEIEYSKESKEYFDVSCWINRF